MTSSIIFGVYSILFVFLRWSIFWLYFWDDQYSDCIFEMINILMMRMVHYSDACGWCIILTHADDALLFASTRSFVISKLKRLANYCKRNSITIEPSKSNFIVINGTDDDHRNLPLGDNLIDHEKYLLSLDSHLSEKGTLQEDPKHHLTKRYPSCIKFYNFVRSNMYAPLPIKLNVLKSCVMSNLQLWNIWKWNPKCTKCTIF